MASLPLVTLEQSASLPVVEVGEKTTYLAKLAKAGFPLPPTLVIPRRTLETISEENHLVRDIQKVVQHLDVSEPHNLQAASQQIKRLITNQTIPEKTSLGLLKEFRSHFGKAFVAIRTSEHQRRDPGFHHALLNIRGENSILMALLEAWAKEFSPKLLVYRLRNLEEQHAVPMAILVQKQVDADVSGLAYTKDPTSHAKERIIIKSTWGIGDHLQGDELDLDTYQVDIRTNQVVSRQIAHKTAEHIRTDSGSYQQELSKDVMLQSSLSDNQIDQLAGVIIRLKRAHLEHLLVRWTFHHHQLYLIGVETLDQPVVDVTKSDQLHHQATRTQVLISVANPKRVVQQLTNLVDGIGLLKSDFTWMKLSDHPLALLQQGKAKLISHQLRQTLDNYLSHLPGGAFCLYRPLNLTSFQLGQLNQGRDYEASEMNPELGFRGSLRLVHQPDLLRLEAEVVEEASHHHHKKVAMLAPWVRSPAEFGAVKKILASNGQTHQLAVWLDITTPAAVVELEQYLAQKPAGIFVSLDELVALAQGYDLSDPELASRYQPSTDLADHYLQQILQITQKELGVPVLVYLHEPTHQLIETAVAAQVEGIVTPPARAQLLKRLLVEVEQN